jgi:hypothetical protein
VPTLRHATPARNLASIRRSGLLTSKSLGRLAAVWLHSPAASLWAVLHVGKRHSTRVESVVVLEVDVPRRWLRRSKRRLWVCLRDVPPSRIAAVVTFAELAASPVGPAS